jgi:hypothetical protein
MMEKAVCGWGGEGGVEQVPGSWEGVDVEGEEDVRG